MGWYKGKVMRGRSRMVAVLVNEPDEFSSHTVGGLGVAVNTASPMSRGVDGHYPGDPGFGVNRGTGLTEPLQGFQGVAAANLTQRDLMLGAQAGPSSQPGYPSTGSDDGLADTLAAMSYEYGSM